MIDSFWLKDEGKVRTTGCSCCSFSYDDIDLDREEILESLVDNLEVIDKALKYYNMSIEDFRRIYVERLNKHE